MVAGVSWGMLMGVPGFSVFQRGEKVFTYATRSARCCGVSGFQEGMLVVTKPRWIAWSRSSSVGNVPVGVDLHLKVAAVKSRGFGSIHGAFSPFESPSGPWQPMQ